MKRTKHLPKNDPPAPERLGVVIESLLFVADEPQPIDTLAKSLNVRRDRIEQAIEELAVPDGRGIFVQRQGDRVQLATVPEAAPYIERFLEVEHGRLSNAALETLAIVAYRQPMTRGGIDNVRGVNSDGAVATLLARGLIEEVGRAPGPGRPALFGTTVRFLEYFGLSRADALPPLAELEDAQPHLGAGDNGATNGVLDLSTEHTNGHAASEDWSSVETESGPSDSSEAATGEIATDRHDDLGEATDDEGQEEDDEEDWSVADSADLPPDAAPGIANGDHAL